MIGNCAGCAPAADVKERSRARGKLPWLAFLPAVLAAIAPKCPMCVTAYLSAFGVTFGMASFALSVLPPLAMVFVLLVLGLAVRRAKVSRLRRRSRRHAAEPGSSSAAVVNVSR